MAIPIMIGADLFGKDATPDCYRRLAQGVIIQAARDASAGDLDAAWWLVSLDTADTWLTLADVDRHAVLDFLRSGGQWAKRKKPRKVDVI